MTENFNSKILFQFETKKKHTLLVKFLREKEDSNKKILYIKIPDIIIVKCKESKIFLEDTPYMSSYYLKTNYLPLGYQDKCDLNLLLRTKFNHKILSSQKDLLNY